MDMKFVRSGWGVVVQVSHGDGRLACSRSLLIHGHELIAPPEDDSSDLYVDKYIHDNEQPDWPVESGNSEHIPVRGHPTP